MWGAMLWLVLGLAPDDTDTEEAIEGQSFVMEPGDLERYDLRRPALSDPTLLPAVCEVTLGIDAKGAPLPPQITLCEEPVAEAMLAAAQLWTVPLCAEVELGEACRVSGALMWDDAGVRVFNIEDAEWNDFQILKQVPPTYPDFMKTLDRQGKCRLRVFIDSKGEPYDVLVEDCDEGFEAAALEVAPQWRFAPRTVEGVPVRSQFVLTVTFELKGPAQRRRAARREARREG